MQHEKALVFHRQLEQLQDQSECWMNVVEHQVARAGYLLTHLPLPAVSLYHTGKGDGPHAFLEVFWATATAMEQRLREALTRFPLLLLHRSWWLHTFPLI